MRIIPGVAPFFSLETWPVRARMSRRNQRVTIQVSGTTSLLKKGGSGAGQAPDQGAFRGAEAPREWGREDQSGVFRPPNPLTGGPDRPPRPLLFYLCDARGALRCQGALAPDNPAISRARTEWAEAWWSLARRV